MEEFDSKLGLYSDNNLLTAKLSEKFNSKYVEVQVFRNFSKIDLSKISYLIINLLDDSYDHTEIIKAVESVACKIIVLAPHKVDSSSHSKIDSLLNKLIETNLNLGVLLVPEIIGDSVQYNESFVSHNLIMQSLLSDRVKISDSKEIINLISINKLTDEIVKQTFSFGISGQKLLVSGFNKDIKDFIISFLGINSENVLIKSDTPKMVEINPTSRKDMFLAVQKLVNKNKNSFNVSKIVEPEKRILQPISTVHQNVNKKKLNNLYKKVFISLLVFVVVLVTPLLMLTVSTVSLFVSYKVAEENSGLSSSLVSFAGNLAKVSNEVNVGAFAYGDYSNLILKITTISKESIEMIDVAKQLLLRINGDDTYDVQYYADLISASLDKIHTDISYMQGDIEGQEGYIGEKIRQILSAKGVNLNVFKEKIYNLKRIVSRLSWILGVDSPKKYLVLFQNNMELRPTGGFIGSFALVTFDQGRMTEIVVSDVYSADGQLKGHIDPPEPIKKYLGEASWYLRDSNWDPNFESSAIKAEWFLDKELDLKVDGVLAIDLYFIQKLLNVTGPIVINDFGKTVDSENLYLTTQSEVENQFFPGSIKKASFLTALSKNLLTEIEKINSDKYPQLFKEIYNSLEERHIQVYFHDLNTNEAFVNMGYSGRVDMSTDCNLRCFKDIYGLVDANLGVNKSNLFVTRDHELTVSVDKSEVKHELFVTYNNSAGYSLGPSGIHKSYTRILLPKDSVVAGVRLYDSVGNINNLDIDKVETENGLEVGFWFETKPSSASKIQIVWNLPTISLEQGGEYNLQIRKQAGTSKDSLKVNINSNDFTLTGNVNSVYNTTLDKDFNQKVFLK